MEDAKENALILYKVLEGNFYGALCRGGTLS